MAIRVEVGRAVTGKPIWREHKDGEEARVIDKGVLRVLDGEEDVIAEYPDGKWYSWEKV